MQIDSRRLLRKSRSATLHNYEKKRKIGQTENYKNSCLWCAWNECDAWDSASPFINADSTSHKWCHQNGGCGLWVAKWLRCILQIHGLTLKLFSAKTRLLRPKMNTVPTTIVNLERFGQTTNFFLVLTLTKSGCTVRLTCFYPPNISSISNEFALREKYVVFWYSYLQLTAENRHYLMTELTCMLKL